MTISISGLERFKQERDMLQLGLQGLEHSSSPEGKLLGELLKGILPDLEQNEPAEWRLTAALVKAIVERYDQIILCSEEGKPFIANSFGNAPELFVALDLPWYTVSMIPFLPTAELYIPDEIDEAERLGMATDMCTLFRLGISNVELGRVPKPTAFVGILSPCDGAGMFHQAIAHNKDWRNIPFFCTDLPYVGKEHAIDFHALELQQMAAFLEEHTGRRLDVERLREVIKESNKQYQLWAEYNELRRAVPCPHSAAKGAQAWMVAQNFLVGDPKGTEWFCSLVEITEQRIKEGKGNVPDERIRLLWSQIPAVWLSELADWLREEWKACIVMDMIGYTPYTPIDTSSLESMFRGLAKRNLCDLPMVRLDRGTTDILLSDIRRIVKDYRIDCVVWPQNVGHKGGAASMGIMRELCREQGVPFLVLCLDLFNGRYIPISEVKSRFSEFFTATGLG